MSEAVAEVMKFAFTKLKFRRLSVCAFAENKASNGLIEKLGFKHEGVFRKSVRDRATGAIHDTQHYGLLKEDWLRMQKLRLSRKVSKKTKHKRTRH
jgi:ribosomal-protein-alanine N-acetyltransferase